MLNLNSVMIGTEDPEKLTEFYKKVFAKDPDMSEEGWSGWQMGSCFFGVGKHSEVTGESKEKDRIILNYETKDVEGEFQRIKDTGAEVVKEPYEMGGMWIATFKDPDNNLFQLMSPWEQAAN